MRLAQRREQYRRRPFRDVSTKISRHGAASQAPIRSGPTVETRSTSSAIAIPASRSSSRRAGRDMSASAQPPFARSVTAAPAPTSAMIALRRETRSPALGAARMWIKSSRSARHRSRSCRVAGASMPYSPRNWLSASASGRRSGASRYGSSVLAKSIARMAVSRNGRIGTRWYLRKRLNVIAAY